MSYKLKPRAYSSPNRVVLKRSNVARFVVGALFLLLGFGALVTGGLLLLDGNTAPVHFVLAGFGLVFTAGALLLLQASTLPKRLIFDNERGALFLDEKGARRASAMPALPYEQIDGFQVRERISTGQRGSSVSYVVDLLKTDGAFWSLLSTYRAGKAEALCRQLAEQVDLEQPYGGDAWAEPPHDLESRDVDDATQIRWKVRQRSLLYLAVVGMLGGFGLALVGARENMGTLPFVLVAGFLGVFAVLFVYGMIANAGKTQVIAVTPSELRVFQEGGVLTGLHFTMPLAELKAILFNISDEQHDGALYFLREEERGMLEQVKLGQVGLGDVGAMFGMMMRVKKIPLEGHTVGEMLWMEQHLQRLIEERSGLSPE